MPRDSDRSHPDTRVALPVLDPGNTVHDPAQERSGEIIDVARQYAHPKADPVHHYLVRWDDGIVEALHERAFTANWGLEVED